MKKGTKAVKVKKTESVDIVRIDNGFVIKVLNDDFDTKAERYFPNIGDALDFIGEQF